MIDAEIIELITDARANIIKRNPIAAVESLSLVLAALTANPEGKPEIIEVEFTPERSKMIMELFERYAYAEGPLPYNDFMNCMCDLGQRCITDVIVDMEAKHCDKIQALKRILKNTSIR